MIFFYLKGRKHGNIPSFHILQMKRYKTNEHIAYFVVLQFKRDKLNASNGYIIISQLKIYITNENMAY